MGGTSLAAARRRGSRLFTERVFVGRAIDIGAGDDPLTFEGFPLLREVVRYDKDQGDAQELIGVPPESFDVVYSSHCLEHLDRPYRVMSRWWELVKVGGHLALVVPDEGLYERFRWPSAYNVDHRHPFSTRTLGSFSQHLAAAVSFRVQEIADACRGGRLISLVRLEDGFDPSTDRDQTADETCECGIELVVRKESRS